MNLGDKVTYIRQHMKDDAPTVSEGEGTIIGIGLDPDNRAIVLLKDGDERFNALMGCLNRDKEFHDAFRAAMTEIEAISKEGNEAVKVLAGTYNDRVCVIYDTLVGKPLDI